MTRIIFVAVLVVVFVCADNSLDRTCTAPWDCPCGSVCNAGICAEGCMMYGVFLPLNSEKMVYGSKCRRDKILGLRGPTITCEKGGTFVAPEIRPLEVGLAILFNPCYGAAKT